MFDFEHPLKNALEIPSQFMRVVPHTSERTFRLHATTFLRSATVVRQRGNVLNGLNHESSGLQRRNSAFASASGTFDLYIDFLDPHFHRFLPRLLARQLTGIRRAFPTSFKSAGAGACETKDISFLVGNCDNRIIESRLDMSDCRSDISANFAAFSAEFSHWICPPLLCRQDMGFTYFNPRG